MYCNNCGKEILNGMPFCNNCGAKNITPDRGQNPVCSNCGRTAKNNEKFCMYCGGQISYAGGNVPHAFTPPEPPAHVDRRFVYNSAKPFGFVALAMVVILSLIYLITAIGKFEGNMDAFYWLDDENRVSAIILHWIPCILIICDCIICVVRSTGSGVYGRYLLNFSIQSLILTFILWIGRIIFNDFDYDDLSILMYRIFGAYSGIIIVSFLLSVIIMVFAIICNNAERTNY